jgi:hypothetical protein
VKIVHPLALTSRPGYEVRVDDLSKSGIYRLDYAQDHEAGRKPLPPTLLAVNVDPRESDLARIPSVALAASFPSESLKLIATIGEEEAGEADPDQRAWWWVVWLVLGMLVAETILSQLFARTGRGGDSS